MAAPRKYSLELRERAVRMYRASGGMRGWIRQAEADAGERDDRPTTGERSEPAALRVKAHVQIRGPLHGRPRGSHQGQTGRARTSRGPGAGKTLGAGC